MSDFVNCHAQFEFSESFFTPKIQYMHRERRQRRKLTPTVMTASFSKEFAVK